MINFCEFLRVMENATPFDPARAQQFKVAAQQAMQTMSNLIQEYKRSSLARTATFDNASFNTALQILTRTLQGLQNTLGPFDRTVISQSGFEVRYANTALGQIGLGSDNTDWIQREMTRGGSEGHGEALKGIYSRFEAALADLQQFVAQIP